MVSSLTLSPDTTILKNQSITQIFVAYKFLNCDPAELETPMSLPKPAANRPIHFNFKKGGYSVASFENENSRLLFNPVVVPPDSLLLNNK